MPALKTTNVVLAVILVSILGGTRANGAFVMDVTQTAQGVLVTGSGTIKTTSLTAGDTGLRYAQVDPEIGYLISGPDASVSTESEGYYGDVLGPASLGPGGDFGATTGSGQIAGVGVGGVIVPSGYVSGSELSDTCLFYELTFNYLGLTQGQYVYTWGSGATADSLTINIGTPVPEPASVAVAAIPTVALLRRRQRRLSI